MFDLTCCLSLSLPFSSLYLSLPVLVYVCLCAWALVCVYVDYSLTVKPTISEAELASVDVQPYMFGKQHQLTCTAYGVPMPTVTWHWQRCYSDATLKE